MGDEPKTNEDRADRIGELIAEIQLEAVEAERQRCWHNVADVLNKAWKKADSSKPAWADLVNCRDALLPPDSQPPAPEPMTVAKMMKRLRQFPDNNSYTWEAIEKDLTTLVDVASQDCRLIACLHPVCEKRIRCSEPKPPPPVPEPMTVEKVLAKIRAGYPVWEDWDDCERDLERLVEEQARRDAEIAETGRNPLAGRFIAIDIRKSAGLE